MKNIFTACALIFTVLFSTSSLAEVKAGEKAPGFEGKTITGETIALEKFKGKFVVIEWFHPACPFTGKHYSSKNMQTLQKKYAAKDVAWISINTESGEDSAQRTKKINEWIKSVDASASYYILDQNAAIASLYQAKTTPHIFVINPEGMLIYSGAIDDKRSTKVEDVATAKNYLSAALDSAMAGKEVEIKNTRSYGCPVRY